MYQKFHSLHAQVLYSFKLLTVPQMLSKNLTLSCSSILPVVSAYAAWHQMVPICTE